MKPSIKVYLLDDAGERFFGDGPCRLLTLVEQTGSLRAAAMQMGMAYTKAMKLLRHAEETVGEPLTVRCTGGKAGGGSRLTKRGKELVEQYERYKELCAEAGRGFYSQVFEGGK